MFWKKKKLDRNQCPAVENLDEFVEWLLRYSDDFEIFRTSAQASISRFVRHEHKTILEQLGALDDEEKLAANFDASTEEYNEEYKERVDSSGALKNLPSHIHEKAFPLLVKLRVITYIMRQRHGRELTEPVLPVSGLSSNI